MSGLPFVLKAEFVGNGRGLFSAERGGLVKTQEKYVVGDESDRYWFAKRLSENPELQNGDRVRIRDIVEELYRVEEDLRRRVRQEDITEATKDEPGLVTICLADVKPTSIEWLWENRIALGKMSILYGLPGLGKSFISLDIAARVSRGEPWPDRRLEKVKRGHVLLLSCEDGLADTIVHRLKNAKADLDRIKFIEGVKRPEAKGEISTFSLQRDLRHLEAELDKNPDIRLLIIDPLSAYYGQVDAHKDAEIRSVLGPVAKLADEYGVAILGVAHSNKAIGQNALGRLMGSTGIGAAARAVWLVCQDPQDEDRRLVVQAKNNLAQNPGGLAYRIEDPGQVHWDNEPVRMTADEAMAPKQGRPASTRDEAESWIQERLKGGPVLASTMMAEGEDRFAESTLRRAKRKVGVLSRKQLPPGGKEKRYYWILPGGSEVPPVNIYDHVDIMTPQGGPYVHNVKSLEGDQVDPPDFPFGHNCDDGGEA